MSAERQRDDLAALIRALRGAGLDPDWAGLADALWLAQFSRPAHAPEEAEGGRSGPREPGPGAGPGRDPARAEADSRPPGDRPVADPGEEPRRPAGTRAPRAQDDTVRLYADPAGSGRAASGLPDDAMRVGVPEARALPSLLELERALRPLQRYRPPARPPRRPTARALDERATVERTARAGGVLSPAFLQDDSGQTELQLLMDSSSAMRVWQRMFGELSEVFARLGAFRDIQVHYLHRSPDGSPAVSRRFDPAEAPLRPASQLADPTGRRLTVVVSDCAGPLWREGAAHRLLHRLSRYAPVAVVQPLPQRLWARTRLPVRHGLLQREEGPAGSARLRFVAEDLGYPAPQPRAGTVAVPVLPPTAASLGAWARLLSGPGAGAVPAAVGWVRADQPPAPARRPGGVPRTSAGLVARFRSTASPGAGQLAVYLSAAPLFLPVMQLVQRTMVPDSGPAELSEVLLSGLLRRMSGSPDDGRWYEFADGVHDELLRELGQDEALLVLKHCSGYVEQRFGKAGPNFPALALAQLSGDADPAALTPPAGEEPAEGRLPRPFAEVAAKVLRHFLPGTPLLTPGAAGPAAAEPSLAVGQARALAERFDADGKVQHQLDAVRLLRQAAESQRTAGLPSDPELWSELAEQLLRLWRVQRDGELLNDAQDAARIAAAHPGSLSARAALARVLHAVAGEKRAAGDTRTALELWRRADGEFAAVCATPGLDPRLAVDLTLEHIQVLEQEWRLSGDTRLLQRSIGMVEAVADAWPESDPQPSGLPLAHGRALLRLAAAAPGAEPARVYAGQAAESLRLGCWALEAESAPVPGRVRALLDLVDALLLTEREWLRAGEVIAQARRLTERPALLAACLIRAGRLAVRRYDANGEPADLEEAARRFEEASRSVSRDKTEYSDLIEEWGAALLRRAQRPDGGAFISKAVRVLRDCRMETPAGDPRLPPRLLMLGQALIARYQDAEDLVDLREAEHLFTLTAHDAEEPLVQARAWFELGETHRRAYRHTRRTERLDQAGDAYRRTAMVARGVEPTGESDELVRLAATALHQRGVVMETARRPLAAGQAYRSALQLWHRLPEDEKSGLPDTTARLDALRRDI
ncbi:SAV_2336 N-terminal domain-related protein [Streptomyces litchfieldiae]|uniref:SAV_2336 N-terminal domain-related protein n=1 Tax=Streptomyces litchfieldiae TaxID=3075543 RepID=A0ABU2MJ34_9ACTN|nr:SAV_2336 N-terminal domain-related protein [Streptomyces sp. DSM 44938]MDT0341612.1 SAV_2336 N-terminal domain-related protein [Streptomyces sp. DSM 44938]